MCWPPCALCRLWAHIEKHDSGDWHVTGVGPMGLSGPDEALDFGNAGTGVRLVMGLVAGAAIGAQFTGDTSLSARPMERILSPLRAMGAQAQATNGCLPVKLNRRFNSGHHHPQYCFAQVKSAILLAALGVAGTTTVREKIATRGHSESMMRLMGADIRVEEKDGYREVSLHNETGPTCLKALDLEVRVTRHPPPFLWLPPSPCRVRIWYWKISCSTVSVTASFACCERWAAILPSPMSARLAAKRSAICGSATVL